MERFDSTSTDFEVEHSLIPPMWDNSVREVSLQESDAAGLSLAHSFATDPSCRYILDADDMAKCSPEKKWELHVFMMTSAVASHCLRGAVTTIGPDYDAVAVWEIPGSEQDGLWTMLRSGMLKLYFQLSPESRKRYYKQVLPLYHATLKEVMGGRSKDCYYLAYIGTKPSARGKGYAKKLIQDMIRRADSENRPMYLESTSAANNSFYEKFGFKLRKHVTFSRGRIPVELDVMVREPRLCKM